MKTNKNQSLYTFLEELIVKEDGSFNYNITNRILEKYSIKSKLGSSKEDLYVSSFQTEGRLLNE